VLEIADELPACGQQCYRRVSDRSADRSDAQMFEERTEQEEQLLARRQTFFQHIQ